MSEPRTEKTQVFGQIIVTREEVQEWRDRGEDPVERIDHKLDALRSALIGVARDEGIL